MVGAPPYRRWLSILSWFDPPARPAGHRVATEASFDGFADRPVPTGVPGPFVSEPRLSKAPSRSAHASIRYLAIGTPADRKAFTTAIRAFALAGKLGDSLTLIGYGRHRRRLEKWSTALGIDATVAFADPQSGLVFDPDGRDRVILLSPRDERQTGLLPEILAKGLSVISMSRDLETVSFIRDRKLGSSIGAADALGLGHAMLSERHSSRSSRSAARQSVA